MSKKVSELTKDELIIDALAIQYIHGKAVNSAAEYVELFKLAKAEIGTSYKGANNAQVSKKSSDFNLDSMI